MRAGWYTVSSRSWRGALAVAAVGVRGSCMGIRGARKAMTFCVLLVLEEEVAEEVDVEEGLRLELLEVAKL